MEWKELRLKDISDLITKGTTPSFLGGSFSDTGINFIKSECLDYDGIIDSSKFAYIDEKSNQLLKRSILKKNDILFSIAGVYLGKTGLVKEKYLPANTNQACAIIRLNNDLVDYKFIRIYFTNIGFITYVNLLPAQAAQPNINLTDLSNLKLRIPPLPIQKKIAGILSAYDDLIENNKRRMELLEKAAQNIYKEWFVRMRFPGYQSTKYQENGLPEGWEVKKLGEVVEINKGKNITKKTIKEGNIPVVAGGINPAYYHNRANTNSPTITISASGANAGFVNIYFENIWASDCSYIDAKATQYLFFLYLFLKDSQEIVYHLQKGSAQPHVYPKDLQLLDLLLPSNEILVEFEKQSNSIYQEVLLLQQKNEKLRSARNRLLPKLVSGKLSVEHLADV